MKENKAVNLIMPMAGAGSRFAKDGIITPKPLIDLHGKPFFYWAANSIVKYVNVASLVFVILEEHKNEFALDKKVQSFYPNAVFITLPQVLNGAVMTCRAGVQSIDNGYPIIFNDCDHLFRAPLFYDYCNKCDFDEFIGILLTFKANDANKHSFIEYDRNGLVKRTVEKEAISEDAICGAYYFKNKEIFLHVSDDYLKNCSYNEYFMSGVYNSLVASGGKIGAFPVSYILPFGTPEEYNSALDSTIFLKDTIEE
jgi:dTDP-glucose pyrophosphorylase